MIFTGPILGLLFAFAIGQPVKLEWFGDGIRVLVGNRWMFDSSNGQYLPIGCAPPGCQDGVPSLAAGGRTVLVLNGSKMAFGKLPGTLGPWMAIPQWLRGDSETLANAAFWITPTSAFVQQFNTRSSQTPVCRVYDTEKHDWQSPSGGCLSPAFSYLAQVDSGPKGLLALHSSAEGTFALQIVRYSTSKGQSRTGVKPIMIEGASSVSVHFGLGDQHVYLVTPCRLTTRSTIQCVDEVDHARTWRLYSVTLSGGAIRLLRTDLPPGAVLHGLSKTFAWIRQEALCMGDPREHTPRCFPLPR